MSDKDELRMMIESGLIDSETANKDRNGLSVTLRFEPEDMERVVWLQNAFPAAPMEEWMKNLVLGKERIYRHGNQ